MSSPPDRIFVCYGSDCRKRRKELKGLAKVLGDQPHKPVRCQDICKGPVVGVRRKGVLRWFKKVDDKKHWAAILSFFQTGEKAKRLWGRHVRKRKDKLKK